MADTKNETMSRVVRVGVLGTARVVAYGLIAPAKEVTGIQVTSVASRTLAKAQQFAKVHGIPQTFGSYDALLESTEVDAVYIALPTSLHYEWSKRTLEAGKHVLCEKPLTENARQAEALAQLAKGKGRVLLEAMHMHYFARIRRQRELLLGGEFGKLTRIESCFRMPYTPMAKGDFRLSYELGGGAALDVGCYAVSCLRYVSGEEPEVLSVQYKSIRPEVDRWMRAEVRLPSGASGLVECGFRGLYLPRASVELTFANGSIKWNGKGLECKKGDKVIQEAFETPSTYRLQLEAFVKAVKGEASDILSPEDVVATAKVLDAMYQKAGLAPRGARIGV